MPFATPILKHHGKQPRFEIQPRHHAHRALVPHLTLEQFQQTILALLLLLHHIAALFIARFPFAIRNDKTVTLRLTRLVIHAVVAAHVLVCAAHGLDHGIVFMRPRRAVACPKRMQLLGPGLDPFGLPVPLPHSCIVVLACLPGKVVVDMLLECVLLGGWRGIFAVVLPVVRLELAGAGKDKGCCRARLGPARKDAGRA